MPGVCIVFAFAITLWTEFCRTAPNWFVQRMTEGDGAIRLKPITADIATAVVATRMADAVWKSHPTLAPPGSPLFPFAADEVEAIRSQNEGELRRFLMGLHTAYEEHLTGKRPTLEGKPAKPSLDDVPSLPPPPVPPPVLIPPVLPPLPSPLLAHIDMQKLRQHREKVRGMTQLVVAQKLGIPMSRFAALDNGKLASFEDEKLLQYLELLKLEWTEVAKTPAGVAIR